MSVLRTQQKQLAEQVKKANQDKASAEAGMNNMEKQAETIRGELHLCQIHLETEKQMVLSLREELRRPKKLPSYRRRQPRPRSKLLMLWGWKKLKVG